MTQERLKEPTPPLKKSPIICESSKEAMVHNSKVLRTWNYDIEKLIDYRPHSDLSHSYEFRDADLLRNY